MAVDHKGFRAGKLETITGAHRLQFGLERAMFCALVDRERGEQRAVEIFGRCAAFCASLPPRVSADAASTAELRNGDGISVRPISSITTPASTQPSPLPPKFSGTSRPEKPSRQTPSRARGKTPWRLCCRVGCADATPAPCR